MELKELTSAFAAKMGIDGLTVEDGVCALEIDGIPLQIAETAAGGAVVLQWRIPTRDVELDGFCAELEAFVNQVEQWRLALENFRPAAEEAAARDEEAPAMGLPASGFISV